MSRGPYPIMLMLAMSLPGTVRALGLGEIRVDSALNEPLSAQIDIVGATRDELAALTASVANREIFQRYGADRPSFLSSATFKVGMDAEGHPVLNVRSADPFTDPLVSFLVDLRWGKNEVVREYALLLDPPGYKYPRSASDVALASVVPAASGGGALASATPTARNAASAPSFTAPGLPSDSVAPARRAASTMAVEPMLAAHSRITIAAGDTLRGIARRVGARTEAQAETLMIVMFRANPNAFDGNINRLRRGAELIIPSATEVAGLSSAEARHEVHAQMTAWHVDGRPGSTQRVAALPVAPAAAGTAATPTEAPLPVAKEEETPDSALKNRVQSLEQQLDDMNKRLASENAQIQTLSQATALASAPTVAPVTAAPPVTAAITAAPAVTEPVAAAPAVMAPVTAAAPEKPTAVAIAATTTGASKPPTSTAAIFGPVVVALGLLLAGFAYLRKRFVRPTVDPLDRAAAEPAPVAPPFEAAVAASQPEIAHTAQQRPEPTTPTASYPIEHPMPLSSAEITANLEIDIEALERSYLEGLPSEAAAHEAKTVDATAPNEVITATDTQKFANASIDSDLNTVLMDARNMSAPPVHTTALDFDLMDLDSTAQHVQMPSALHDHPVLSERRMNIVDVLKMAIERDPGRRDLRMKLLETYYSSASTNRRAFMDVVRKLSREKDALTPTEWKRVMMMGREIAPDDILFADLDLPKEDKDLASCA